jgi:hypothetical protein
MFCGSERLKIEDVVKGKLGIGGKNHKDIGKHKVPLLTILGKMFTTVI